MTTHLTDEAPASVEQFAGMAAVYRAHIGRFLPRSREASILDIGCGSGRLVWFLQQQGYQYARGIDVSPEQVHVARSLGIDSVACASVSEYLPAHPKTFDLIVAIDVLEHLTKPEVLELLDASYRALKVGGRLLVQTTNGAGPFGGYYLYGDFTHQTAFSARSMRQILRNAGFDDIGVFETRPVAHGIKSALRKVAWLAIRGVLVAYLAAETGVVRGHVLTQNLLATARRSA